MKTATKSIKWETTKGDTELIFKIAERATKLAEKFGLYYDFNTASMDITAAHANGCELDLQKLLDAPDGDFGHDVFGIRRHINRQTGELENCFLPRCAHN